jgi:diaminopimelate decarboxylase
MPDAQQPANPSISRFPVVDGVLTVGGIPLDRLAQRIGSTPFFAYDRQLVTERMGDLRSAMPDRVSINYAIKANPMPALVQHLAGMADGFDVASAYEMRTALDAGQRPELISFAGPGKTDQELRQAIAAGITVEMESESEMRRVASIADTSGYRPHVAIRVNPDFRVKGSGMTMGGGSAQFGVDSERVPAMLGEAEKMDLDLVGLHIFSGSQNLNAEVLAATQEQTIDLAVRLLEHSTRPFRKLNIGGGFGIPYFPKDRPLDLSWLGARLDEALERPEALALADTQIVIELGRYIVGEAGLYVSRVIDRKESRGQVFLITDGGLHHQLAASGNFGQVIRRNYPLAVGTKTEGRSEIVNVVGCLCTPLDLLGDRVALPVADVGDLLVVFQSGAYGLTASPTAFLGHPAPVEVLV